MGAAAGASAPSTRVPDTSLFRRAGAAVLPAAAVLAVQQLLFPVPLGVVLQGVVLGLINAMVVLGLILVYRANRVINFAQASIGVFPAATAGAVVLFGAPALLPTVFLAASAGVVVFLRSWLVTRRPLALAAVIGAGATVFCGVGLHSSSWLGWVGGLLVGLTVAVLCGMGTHVIVIRRLSEAPRLLVTVATIGLAQLFAILGLLVPRLWGQVALIDTAGDRTGFDLPFQQGITVGSTVFGSAELVAVGIAVVSILAISIGLRRSHVGIAVRAAADSRSRASMLGVPVPRLEGGVWIVASVLAFLATYAQAGILGLELTPGVGLRVMVAALAAMALGGFRDIPAQLLAAVVVGVLVQATGPAGGHSLTLTDAVLGAVVIVALLVRPPSRRRADRVDSSSWQTVAEPRAVPPELARLPVVRAARLGAPVVLVAVALGLGAVLSESDVLRATTLVALVVVAASIVVLTGWMGSVTLGQMSFAAVGAAVAAAATARWHADLTLALLLGGAAAAVVAVVVGLPSLRRQGLLLAVTTLAFALAATNYLCNPTVVTWIPTEDLARRPLFGIIDLASRRTMYEVAVVVATLCFVGLVGVRRSRVGRLLRAVRDNPDAAAGFGTGIVLARLSAFALSGFVAGIGGVLLFAAHERYEVAMFGAGESLNLFMSSVVGGVGSLVGAASGTVLIEGARGFLSGPVSLLPSALGVLGVILLLPGGVADVLYRARDAALRSLARRRGIHVPSLVADRRVPEPTADRAPAPGVPPGRPDAAAPTTPATPGWLSVRGLDVAYDGVQVLFDVDVDIPEGSFTALLGTNGAGKSTLLRAIGGVAPVTGGSIHFDGVDLGALAPEEVPAHGIVQMPGGHGVFPSLTVDENLRVASWLFRHDRDQHRRVDEALAHFPVLQARRHDHAADLSGGQQQQLALAMALLGRPRLLLIDELSIGLAPAVVETLLDELRALHAAGTTVVIVEQSVNVALTVADHAYFMEKGEIRFSGRADELLAQPDLVRAVYLHGAQEALGGSDGAPLAATAEAAAVPPDTGMAPVPHGVDGSSRPAAPAASAVPALEVRDLAVTFGGNAAVSDVSFAARPGEIIGLIGPNGAGKTTVLDLVSGFTALDRGRVLLDGDDVTALPAPGRARRGIGRSFQDARLFAGLTVAETIAVSLERWVEGDGLVAGALRLPASHAAERHVRERVDELVAQFGLEAFRAKRVGELSTGSRRMVDLACVVAQRPSVVLLDEPTSGIAQKEAEALGPLLLGLRDRLGATLVIVEHDIALISSVADRLVALDRGAVVTVGPPGEVLEHPHVVASYLGSTPELLARSDHAGVTR